MPARQLFGQARHSQEALTCCGGGTCSVICCGATDAALLLLALASAGHSASPMQDITINVSRQVTVEQRCWHTVAYRLACDSSKGCR
jgi:hypothetical protein